MARRLSDVIGNRTGEPTTPVSPSPRPSPSPVTPVAGPGTRDPISVPAPVTPGGDSAPAPSPDIPWKPAPAPAEGPAEQVIQDMADALLPVPNVIDSAYFESIARASAYVGKPVPDVDREKETAALAAANRNIPSTDVAVIDRFLDSAREEKTAAQEQVRALAAQARANFLAVTQEVINFSQLAKSFGYSPPDNPFIEISRLNSQTRPKDDPRSKPLTLTRQVSQDILFNVKAYIDLLAAYNSGKLKFDIGSDSSQMSHVRVSFDGMGGSGRPAADLMKFLPSMDEVKKKKAEEAFAVLDFSKRVPYILFTLEYTPVQDGKRKGILVGWRKMSDASGYSLIRRQVFAQTDKRIELDNTKLKSSTAAFTDYAKCYASGFFSKSTETLIYFDDDAPDHEYFIYKLQAWQDRSELKGAIFQGDMTPVSLTSATQLRITSQLKSLDPSGYELTGQETISPWPTFAQNIMGQTEYDWLLAAVNVRASIQRGDSRDVTRKYSYLNARSSFLFEQAEAGKLVQPSDVSLVQQNIQNAIEKFGATRVIQELLSETGVTYFFDGRDANEDTHFDRAGTLDEYSGRIFQTVASAIDADTAVLDLRSLSSNMAKLVLSSNPLSSKDRWALIAPGITRPSEISVPDASSKEGLEDSGLQFVTKLGDIQDSSVDLTTFDGLSVLMRTIRIISDFGPNRLVSEETVVSETPAPEDTFKKIGFISPRNSDT